MGEAVTQMDQATQQNAALVEEMAAAAASLKSQAEELVDAVAFFRLDTTGHAQTGLPAPVAPHALGMNRARLALAGAQNTALH
ncbi:hypothetical protein GCM10023090_22130 [Acidovorax lacteus]|uniref:Methyl-accepting chemotaxis protein n=1 Tax=Acidovorax lacteus TaxID=1924988 RepID=A0ABP8LDE2_9BURK